MMKLLLATLITAVFCASTAQATTTARWQYRDIVCDGKNGIVACIAVTPIDGDIRRYSVAISFRSVIVYDTYAKQRIFAAYQKQP